MKITTATIIFVWGIFQGPSLLARQNPPIKAEVLHLSNAVLIDRMYFTYCEMLIINNSKDKILLNSIHVKSADKQVDYLIAGDLLKKSLSKNNDLVQAGDSILCYLDIPLAGLRKNGKLKYLLNYDTNVDKQLTFIIENRFAATKPVSLSPPLRGENWVAIYSSSWPRGHRRVYYTEDRKSRLPGRFAIDFVKLDANGHLYTGGKEILKNYFGYGADVLAVSDGTITAVRNDYWESASISSNTRHKDEYASGNYLILKIKNGTYAFYEHLMPGSLNVRPGDKVKAGQVIAKVGFTGAATEPHLHFHIADTNSVLGAEGLPFSFNKFYYKGVFRDFSLFGKHLWCSDGVDYLKKSTGRPIPNSVVSFTQ